MLVLGLDTHHVLLDTVEIARGPAVSLSEPRNVFRPLLRMTAAGGVIEQATLELRGQRCPIVSPLASPLNAPYQDGNIGSAAGAGWLDAPDKSGRFLCH
jgi:hypothetical protein